jgi:5,10-methylene-tetrahydrofolate dehydrogenase/methenyl tetrahydrofolate cyclohydrolase
MYSNSPLQVKPGAVVIDVGINVVPQPREGWQATAAATTNDCSCNGPNQNGKERQAVQQAFAPGTYHVVGDVAFSEVSEVRLVLMCTLKHRPNNSACGGAMPRL